MSPTRERNRTSPPRLSRYVNPSPDEVDVDVERAWRYLQTEIGRTAAGTTPNVSALASPTQRGQWPWRSLAAVAVLMLAVFLSISILPNGSAAIVEAADTGLHRIVEGKQQPLRVGEKVRTNEVIRFDGTSSATLAFKDGARLEMGSKSELRLENAESGLRIRLNGGSIIVSAERNSKNNLYIQTSDATISVADTVSMVTAEEMSSQVAVIRGEALIQKKGISTKLQPGEQVATNPFIELRPVSEEIAWSGKAQSYMAMIMQATRRAALQDETTQPAIPPSETFDVVSIRQNLSGGGQSNAPGPRSQTAPGVSACAPLLPLVVQLSPGRLVMRNVSVYQLVALAYGKHCTLSAEQKLLSGPEWIESIGFDIQATFPTGFPNFSLRQLTNGDAPRLQRLLQNMLADRFKLVLHRTTKEVPTYNLTLPKMGIVRLSDNQNPPSPSATQTFPPVFPPAATTPTGPGWTIHMDPIQGIVTVNARSVPISTIVNGIQGLLSRMVVDKTEVKGLIEIPEQTIPVAPATAAAVFNGSEWVPDVLRKVGFELESGRAFVEALVIERIEKPSEN
jgi:uncharacterized protein (TIGR03435 family)